MTALNASATHAVITTFWEAEVVGSAQHGWLTGGRFGATAQTDAQHWALLPQTARAQAAGADLAQHPYVYLRLKEQFFVGAAGPECGLTIDGLGGVRGGALLSGSD
eukprot:TRINITY_DN5970_c0_g1_i1.p3 TRINITY_DN5970_c0_g1~~TRINITY_DN5970_c0_g1_i1.p3  ORF type:complete len:116 (-),score=26.88 TRINITY_DN5970_c0_g1_i1:42-359(-)